MKKTALLAASALLFSNTFMISQAAAAVTVLDPTPAAEGADPTTLAAMELQCDALAAAHGPAWDGELDESSITPTYVSGPTESGTHSIDDALPGTLVGAGTFTPGSVSILGDPYRNGGSVNMFGVRQADGGSYSASQYDFRGQFDTVEGEYVIAGDFGESEAAVRGNCAAFTAQGDNDPRPDWWGEPFHGGNALNPHCMFVGTPAHEEEQDRADEAGTPINQTQTDELLAHEDFGEGFDVEETVLIGQAVICISPSKTGPKGVPGTWTKQNGYTGDKCTTAWFNVAPWGHGSQDSNGTYISVPLS